MKTMRVRVNVVVSLCEATLGRRTSRRQVRRGNCRRLLHLAERSGDVGRIGTTLTEVLMSLMIMSIGVVSVATLFPISALRTLEANKQTNSTIARFNAESVVDVYPSFVHDPDGPLSMMFDPDGGGPLPAFQIYEYNDNYWFGGHNYLVDPYGFQSVNPLPASEPYSPAAVAAPVANSVRDFFGQKNSGVSSAAGYSLPRRYHGGFRFTAASNYGYPTTPAELTVAIAEAASVVTQPDNWKFVLESQCDTSVSPTSSVTTVTLELNADLSSLNYTTPGVVQRAVVFDVDGEHSEVRTLVAGSTPPSIGWSEPLPSRFDGGNIGKVRIEVLDEVYTWMLSVRKRPNGTANVDVVVFFKRAFSHPEYELVHPAKFVKYKLGPGAITSMTGGAGGLPGFDGVDDNGINGIDDPGEIGFPNSNDEPNNRVPMTFAVEDVNGNGALDPGEDLNGNGVLDVVKPPGLRRGGYVYDTKNGLWYRIRAIEYATATGAVLVLDESIKANNTEDLNLNGTIDSGTGWTEDTNGNGTLDLSGLIYHPQVVNVFPLEIKEP